MVAAHSRFKLILPLFLVASAPAMAADVVKTIGASGADYTTIADWEADLDDGTNAAINTTAYGSGDVAIGELIDANYAITGVSLNGGTTVGLSKIILRPSSGNKHDGTFGTGCQITVSGANNGLAIGNAIEKVIEDIEFYGTGTGNFATGYFITQASASIDLGVLTVQRCLFSTDGADHSSSSVSPRGVYISNTVGITCTVQNCVFKNMTSGTGGGGEGILFNYGTTYRSLNNTFVDCRTGIAAPQASANVTVRNNVAVNSSNADFANTANYDTASNNISSDATHGTQTSQTLAELFVDEANGDYTPTTGSDLIDAGTDLATTPTGVNIDAKGRDRDSEGDTWDVGAIESVSGGGSTNPNPITPSIPGGTPDPLRRGPIP